MGEHFLVLAFSSSMRHEKAKLTSFLWNFSLRLNIWQAVERAQLLGDLAPLELTLNS